MLLEWKCVLQFYSMWKVWVVCKEEKCSVVPSKTKQKVEIVHEKCCETKVSGTVPSQKNFMKKARQDIFLQN